MNKKITTLLASSFLFLPAIALAIDPQTWVNDIFSRFLTLVVWPIFIGLSVVMFIFAGVKYVSGDVSAGNKAVVWGTIGIIVAVLGYSAEGIVSNLLDV